MSCCDASSYTHHRASPPPSLCLVGPFVFDLKAPKREIPSNEILNTREITQREMSCKREYCTVLYSLYDAWMCVCVCVEWKGT